MSLANIRMLYRKKALLRMMISYALLSVFLLLLCGGWLYSKANRIVLDEVSREGEGRLSSFQGFVENTFLQKYEDLFSSRVIATINSHSNDEIDYFLDHSYTAGTSRVYRLVNDLAVTVQSNPGLHSVSIYFKRSGFAVDNEFFYSRPENSPDYEFLASLPEQPTETWIPRQHPDGLQLFTLIYTLPYKSTGDQVQGYLLINVSRIEMERQIAFLAASTAERLLVLDASGKPIVNARYADVLDPDTIDAALSAEASGYTIRTDGGEPTVTSYARDTDSAEDWLYVIVRPMRDSFLASQNLKKDIIDICVLVLSVGLLVAVWISRRTYRPLADIVKNIRSRYGSLLPANADSGEYGLIDATFKEMDNSIVRLKGSVKDAAAQRLLSGNLANIDSFEFVEGFDCFAVSHLLLLEGDMDLFLPRLHDRLADVEHDALHDGKRTLRLLFKARSGTPLTEEALVSLLTGAAEALQPEFAFAAGIGAPQKGIEDIHLSDEQAAKALRYRFVVGRTAVVAVSSVAGRAEPVKGIVYEGIQHAVKSGERARAEQFMSQAAAVLYQPGLQLEAIDLALLRLFTALSETLLDSGIHREWFAGRDLFRTYKKDTLATTLNWLRQLALEAAEQFGKDAGGVHAELVHRLKAYIDENAHQDISLDLLADIAGLSPAYVSTLFKEVLRVSYSDYLTSVRMERAKQLLAAGSLTVTEIASRVGYRNLQYFSTRFKAYTGMTPNQYKASLPEA